MPRPIQPKPQDAPGAPRERSFKVERPQQGVNFLFVPQEGPSTNTDPETQQSIRKHVMRNYHESHHTQANHPFEGSEAPAKSPNPLAAQELHRRFRMRSGELKSFEPGEGRRKGKDKGREVQLGTSTASTSAGSHDPNAGGAGVATDSWFTMVLKNAADVATNQNPLPLSRAALVPFGHPGVDPFNALPHRLRRFDELLIDKFRSRVRSPWCPLNGQGDWLQFAMQDVLVFHSTMYNWGMLYLDTEDDFLNRHPGILQHKIEAIRIVNERLSVHQEAMRDGTLAAVATLTNMEMLYGNEDEAEKHMQGLQTLIGMRRAERGDPARRAAYQRRIQILTDWNDILFSELFGKEIRFTELCIIGQKGIALHPAPDFKATVDKNGDHVQAVQELRTEVLGLFDSIQEAAKDRRTVTDQTRTEEWKLSWAEITMDLERQLRKAAQIPPFCGIEEQDKLVWTLTALAGLCYVHYALRGAPLDTTHVKFLSGQLQRKLSLTGGVANMHGRRGIQMMLWILSVGCVVSTGREEHDWFVGQLFEGCRIAMVRSWDTLKQYLSGFIWAGNDDETRFWHAWQDIAPLVSSG